MNTLRWFIVLWFIVLFSVVSVWVNAPSQALSLNLYDWAEWISLTPSERAGMLLISGFLRLSVVWLMTAAAFIVAHTYRFRWVWLGIAALLFVAQLPPFEFFKALDDVNYRQQAFLSVLSLLLSITIVGNMSWRTLLLLILTFVTLVGITWGAFAAQAMMATYRLQTQLAANAIIGLAALALVGALLLNELRRRSS